MKNDRNVKTSEARIALRFHEANSTEQHVQMCFLFAVANLHHSNVCDQVRAVRNT